MTDNRFAPTWEENPADIIMLTNQTSKNFILELPAGRYRLDAGRKMRTLRTILKVQQVKDLIDRGDIAVDTR